MDRRAARLAAACAFVLLATPEAPAQDARAAALGRAVAWLDANASASEASSRGVLDEPKGLVVSSVRLWLAEIAAGEGGVAARHAGLEPVVARAARGDVVAMGAYANWMAGFAALPLIEKSLRARRPEAALQRLVAGFEERQNAEGGWGHGSAGGMVAFYPSTLVITTDFAMFALGMARRLKVAVDGDVVEAGLRLLSDVQAPSGAFPYGGRPYRKGFEAGRTAGAVAALAALGLADDDRFRRAAAYLLANLPATPDGHASPAVHVMWGGVASALLGDDARRAWEEAVMLRLLQAQSPDGSFGDIVAGSPDSMSLMGSGRSNRSYVTALYAAALAAPRSRIVAALRVQAGRAATSRPAAAEPPAPAWSETGAPVVALDGDAERAATLGAGGGVVLRSAETGRELWKSALPGVAEARDGSEVVVDRDLVFAFAATAVDEDPAAVGGAVVAATSRPTTSGRVAAFSAADGSVRWTSDVTGFPAGWHAAPDGLWMRRRTGSLACFDRATGGLRVARSAPAVSVNTTATWLPDGRIVSTDHSALVLRDHEGEEVWRRSLRAPRGVHAPAWSALFADGGALFCGGTDGTVAAWSLADGSRLWGQSVGASVCGIARAPEAADVVLALADDGRLFGLRDGQIAWTREIGGGREALRPGRLRVRGGATWVASFGAARLIRLDPRDGRVVAALPLPKGAAWATFGERAWIAADGAHRSWLAR